MRQLAADQVDGLDAVGALVDRRDAGVAVVLRRAGLLDEAHAAVHLQRRARRPRRRCRSTRPWRSGSAAPRAAWRRRARPRSVARAGEVGGDRGRAGRSPAPPRSCAFISISMRRTSGWSKIARRLSPVHGRAALPALQRIGQRLLVGALGDADALHADVQPRGVHHREHVRQALVRRADQLGLARPRTASRRWARRGCPACARCEPALQRVGVAERAVVVRPAASARGTARCRACPAGASGRRASTRWTMFSAMSWSPQVMKIFWPVSAIAAVAVRLGAGASARRGRSRPAARSGSSCRSTRRRSASAGRAPSAARRRAASSASIAPWVSIGQRPKAMLAACTISKTASSSAFGRPWPP